uniref:Leucine-rich repeat-containing protein 20 n=1 Tax=Panagrolaimus sp. PS1159 TaxID=55785 RepID=A0AC35FWN5_9BILA
MSVTSAARGVTQVMHRCESAKQNGFLDLSSCDLMYVADAIYMVLKGYTVTKCSLSNNVLKRFPAKMITKFPEMIQFSISSNSVTELPEEISNWKLKAINLASNKFAKIPEAIYRMSDLQVLDLSDNEIENIDIKKLITSLPNLKLLNLSNNPLPVKHLQDILGHQTKTLQIKYVVSNTE